MQRFMEIIRSAMAAMSTAVVTVMRPFYVAGRWILRAATEIVLVPGKAVALVLSPVMAAIRSRGGDGGQQAADAAAATQKDVRAANKDADAAAQVQRTAKMLQWAARARSEGRDIKEIASAIPMGWGAYVTALDTDECHKLSRCDVRDVAALIGGTKDSLPGIRSPRDLERDDLVSEAPKPSMSGRTANLEDEVLGKIQAKLVAAGRRKRMDAAAALNLAA